MTIANIRRLRSRTLKPGTREGSEGWRVDVEEVELTRGFVFRVVAHFEGTNAIPPVHDGDAPLGHPVNAVRYYDAATLELAELLADAAAGEMQLGNAPDLQKLAAELKLADRGRLATRTRTADGAVLLGDTAPDEGPRP
jgi:hypothetical protein